jgi:glycosyltransferase involved in cell wall biosynthesis
MSGAALRLGVDGRELRDGVRTGIGRFVEEVLRAASRNGIESVIYSDRPLPVDLAWKNVTSTVIHAPSTVWWDQVRLPRELARDEISVFLSPYYKGPVVARCPVVVTIHDLFFIRYLGRRRLVYDVAATAAARLYARRAAAVLTDSEHSRRAIARRLGVAADRITAIPLAANPIFRRTPLSDAVRARLGFSEPYVLSVGNAKPHKNLPRLFRAFASLPAELRATHRLVLIGDHRDEAGALAVLARELGIGERVIFAGRVEDSDLAAAYTGCALFAMPSLDEGFGLPALEAMACGAPVVASSRASLPEVVGDAGILVPADDPLAIAAAMTRVLTDARLRRDLERRGLERARRFSPERTSERVLELLERVSARRRIG